MVGAVQADQYTKALNTRAGVKRVFLIMTLSSLLSAVCLCLPRARLPSAASRLHVGLMEPSDQLGNLGHLFSTHFHILGESQVQVDAHSWKASRVNHLPEASQVLSFGVSRGHCTAPRNPLSLD